MDTMRRATVFLCLMAVACEGSPRPTAPGHFAGQTWGAAFAAQLQKPDQLAIEASLLVASVALTPFDRRLQQESNEDQQFTEGSTANGDAVAVGLGVMAVGLGATEWIAGDGGHSAEVLAESFLITDGVTEVLKHSIRRDRPGDGSPDSFPSGHTSFAFSMATFLQRRISDSCDGWAGNLGYLTYLPAAYVGIDRSEANRHFPTDVAFGAFLGVLLTNVVYDAHYGSPGQPGLFGVRGLGVEPQLDQDGGGMALVLRF